MKTQEQKRAEAAERSDVYSALTPKQKIEELDRNGFAAIRQRARLQKQMGTQSTASFVTGTVVSGDVQKNKKK